MRRPTLLDIYHRLPVPARSAAATMRGLYLRSWRYGPDTERLVAEAQERERWTPEQWATWREERLARTLHRARTRVPYYRDHWAERRRRGDTASPEYLENWPVIEKDALRAQPLAFLADDCDPRRMFRERTSGTTGRSTTLWWSRDTVRGWYALFDARCRRWYGVSRHDRWAIIGGQLVAPARRRTPPFWVWNAALHQLYMSAWHLAPDLIPAYLDAIDRYRVRHLFGYSSALYTLATEALRLGWRTDRLAAAVTNAEPVFPYQREAIERAFGCPLRVTYGMTEIVATATECEHGTMHLWDEVGWVEVVNRGNPLAGGQVGDLVCTGLFNIDMPLIRYRVGDRGALPATVERCACGRTLSRLEAIEGRLDDLLYTPDGRQVGQLQSIFQADLPGLREAQLVQSSLSRVTVRYVRGPEFSAAHAHTIVERLRMRLGDIEVVLQEVPEILRTTTGKFRYVVSELPPEERARVASR